MTSSLHRLLIVASPLAFVALILPRRKRSGVGALMRARTSGLTQNILFGIVALVAYFALASEPSMFWPILLGTCVVAFLPLPGRPTCPPTLSLPIVLIATTAITHAIFFGDDRYHMVVTPALCLLAAAALRRPQLSQVLQKH